MRSIRSKKSSVGILSKRQSGANERGQVILEYLLILAIGISLFMIVAKPFLGKIGDKFKNLSKQGFLAEDTTGSNFYYFPIPR